MRLKQHMEYQLRTEFKGSRPITNVPEGGVTESLLLLFRQRLEVVIQEVYTDMFRSAEPGALYSRLSITVSVTGTERDQTEKLEESSTSTQLPGSSSQMQPQESSESQSPASDTTPTEEELMAKGMDNLRKYHPSLAEESFPTPPSLDKQHTFEGPAGGNCWQCSMPMLSAQHKRMEIYAGIVRYLD